MKTKEERADDFSAVFESILQRINNKRAKKDKVIILDKERYKAIEDYVNAYGDYVIFVGD